MSAELFAFLAWKAAPPSIEMAERCQTEACKEVYARLRASAREAPPTRWKGLIAPDWKEKRRARMSRARIEEEKFAEKKKEFERDEMAYALAAEAKLSAIQASRERGEDEDMALRLGEEASKKKIQEYEESKRLEEIEVKAYEKRMEEKRILAQQKASQQRAESPSTTFQEEEIPCREGRICT